MRQVVVIAHDMRSCHNVGSLLRTSEGLGVSKVYLTGYTPYPLLAKDQRMAHISAKLDKQIHKTALGAENLITWQYQENVSDLLNQLHEDGFVIHALEQSPDSKKLPGYVFPKKVALLLGREVEGLEKSILKKCDVVLEIPMAGKKESFNVVEAGSMALYQACLL